MPANKARVLLILSQDTLDRTRVLAGRATTRLKLPVSVQIVLRALIEAGLKRDGDRDIVGSIRIQAQAVRRIRSRTRKGRGPRGRTPPRRATTRPRKGSAA